MGIGEGSLLFSAADAGARGKILSFQTILPLPFFLEPHSNSLGSVLSSSKAPQSCLSRWVLRGSRQPFCSQVSGQPPL